VNALNEISIALSSLLKSLALEELLGFAGSSSQRIIE